MSEATIEAIEHISDAPWVFRPYEAVRDEEALMYMLSVGYTRSRAGQRARANAAGRPRRRPDGSLEPVDPQAIERQKTFIGLHRPIWMWLLENAEVTLAVDRDAQDIIWAWLITSGADVVHVVGCKRKLCEVPRGTLASPISVEVVRDMLGERLGRHQVCTLELPQMARFSLRSEAIGIERPREWSMDPTWIATRMMARAA